MNSKVLQMKPFIVMDVLEKANAMQQQGIDIIHLEVGEPDFDMPKCVSDAAQKSILNGETHYTHSLGDPTLRQTIANFYHQEYNIDVDPECITITSGSSPAILMALMVLCGADDEVIMSNPGYACYKNFALACNASPIEVLLDAKTNFQFDIDAIKSAITAKTKAIIVNSPMNPTGTLLSEQTMKQLAQVDIPIISDEIYHGLVYNGVAHTMLEYSQNAFIINGFSKRFAMTGMRLGYLIAPKQYMRQIQTLQQNLFICAPSISQQAAKAALEQAQSSVEEMRSIYNKRRLFMIKRLKEIGFEIHSEPQGAFYIFANAKKFTTDSYKFAFDILENAHVGITPGVDFGTNGEGFVRFSYANSIENITIAMDRLENYIKGH